MHTTIYKYYINIIIYHYYYTILYNKYITMFIYQIRWLPRNLNKYIDFSVGSRYIGVMMIS